MKAETFLTSGRPSPQQFDTGTDSFDGIFDVLPIIHRSVAFRCRVRARRWVGVRDPRAPAKGVERNITHLRRKQAREHHTVRVRNRFLRLLAALLFAICFSTVGGRNASADDLATIKQRGTLRVGVKIDYPPFGFRSPSGEIVGIEPDLAAKVARRLGVKLELVPVTATNRIQLLEHSKIDLIIATMNNTMVRRWAVKMVKPYYYAAGYNIMVPKSMNLTSWAELKGKTVCGTQGAYYNYEAAADLGLHVTAFAGPAEALAALKQGRCVGFLFDDVAIEGRMLEQDWSDYDMPLKSREVQPWSIAVRKDQPEWAAYMSTMVKKWEKDGMIMNLETKYHFTRSRFAEDAHEKTSRSSGN